MKARFFDRLIDQGTLVIHYPDSNTQIIGQGKPTAHIHLRERRVLARLLSDPEMAFGEAYMDGDWWPGEGGLLALFKLYFANANNFDSSRILDIARHALRGLREANSRLRSRRNVKHHYDIDHELFARFLDSDMHYSCAYFESADMDLEAAQQAKCRHIARKLCLEPGDRVLDIGWGWGGLALYLARHHDVNVTGLTLSDDQYAYAQARADREGLRERVRFLKQDYREHQLDGGSGYDAIVSVGMFEHVGRPQFQIFFDQVQRLLKPHGRSLIHTIGRSGPPVEDTHGWIEKYIFPGGYVPSLSEVAPCVEKTGMSLSDLEIWRLHYARTLASWNERFQQHRDVFRERFGERFCRMWEFYLLGCQAIFRWGELVVFHIQLAQRNDIVPVTRDYLYKERVEAPRRIQDNEFDWTG
ncbi:sterol 24-C-methyltransferase protein [Salinisphaera shabanensis E1L3A]|uniref:Sterol 24-C-methyltransferase protein n=1 Tax=Salinisphaera shabanensis E1L3A TaxID=1033802 RepID=U2FU76_9GAMM|nr:cyclopropane-fatty-acyl-phospholipid synthase family protein [Salinisphaera shabanensis]ERJ17928.1 sterol 24-C-methyltransferase protein [Salinisphaera shabanensis E1L3A]